MRHLCFIVIMLIGTNASALERYTGDGEAFDFAIEQNNGVVELFIAAKPDNRPLLGQDVKFVPDAEGAEPIPFKETGRAGVYSFAFEGDKLPEGQVYVGGDIDEGTDAYIEEHGGHDDHDHDDHDHSHSHGAKAPAKLPLWFLLAISLIIGVLLGFVGKGLLARKSAATLALLFAGSGLVNHKAYAGEGHSHGEAKISEAPAGSEVKMTKRSQFMIGLRTQPAKTEKHDLTLKTVGHLVPKPSFNALVTAPRAGFVRGDIEGLWGKKVKQGQSLIQVEAVGRINVTAPISGTIIEVSAVPGTRVEQGAPLFRIVNMEKLWVDAEVFQGDFNLVAKEQGTAVIKVDGQEETHTAAITGAFTSVDEKTLTAKVFLEVDNSKQNMQLGSSVNVALPLTDKEKAGVLLPAKSVLTRGGETLVFVQTDAEWFEMRLVKAISGPEPGSYIVTQGLADGDRVVIEGNYQLLVGAH